LLTRSHRDPSTSLKTSFVRPLTRLPTFATPRRRSSGFGTGDFDSLYEFDVDDIDDGTDLGSWRGEGQQDLTTLVESEVEHGSSTVGTTVGSRTSLDSDAIDIALPYPEWRKEIVMRARKVSRGHRYSFTPTCGHSFSSMKPRPKIMEVEGLRGIFAITRHGPAKNAALLEYFNRIAIGAVSENEWSNWKVDIRGRNQEVDDMLD
jgi:hypothetical protein